MIEVIFTIDYEIYGNGEGSLKELVYDPAERIRAIFEKWRARFVVFVEAAELEVIDNGDADLYIGSVRSQVKRLFDEGFEIGLHLHPQWYNAERRNGRWLLDYREYNLCTLTHERAVEIVERSVAYLQRVVEKADFTPLSFRAGNWLFQPTHTLAAILAEKGIRIDSSVFKGGVQRNRGLDYRPALKNGNYWRFRSDVNKPDPGGCLTEFPIHTVMVPFWKMVTAKRVGLQRKAPSSLHGNGGRLNRMLDCLRPRYPLKFDFCRMSIGELTSMIDSALSRDLETPSAYWPLVAIGHTKDLVDFETIEAFLAFLSRKGIGIVTLEQSLENMR